MGCCISSYVAPPHEYALNELDKHLQQKQGLKTAEQLEKQNRKFAEDPDELRKRKERKFSDVKDVGKWQHTREALTKAQNMSQFAHHLQLSKQKMNDALTHFQKLDKDGNGVIEKDELAHILKIDPDNQITAYLFNALDVDRNGQLNYKEFLVVAAHFSSDLDDMSKARFCFKMVDENNDGVVTFAELRNFLQDVLYSNSSAKHRKVERIEEIITKKLGMQTYDTLTEQDFAELVTAHKDVFTPMLALYSKLHKVFDHTFDRSSVTHSTEEVKEYFNREDAAEGGGGVADSQGNAKKYSSAEARRGSNGQADKEEKPYFQHEFAGSSKKKKAAVPWEQDQHNASFQKFPLKSGQPKSRPPHANCHDSDEETPLLQRKISQDDSLHDYGGGPRRNSAMIAGGRRRGHVIDYGMAPKADVDLAKRVGPMGMGRACYDELDEAPLGSSLNERDFTKIVQKSHVSRSREVFKKPEPVAPMMKFGR